MLEIIAIIDNNRSIFSPIIKKKCSGILSRQDISRWKLGQKRLAYEHIIQIAFVITYHFQQLEHNSFRQDHKKKIENQIEKFRIRYLEEQSKYGEINNPRSKLKFYSSLLSVEFHLAELSECFKTDYVTTLISADQPDSEVKYKHQVTKQIINLVQEKYKGIKS